jgi:hypothetical protein
VILANTVSHENSLFIAKEIDVGIMEKLNFAVFEINVFWFSFGFYSFLIRF